MTVDRRDPQKLGKVLLGDARSAREAFGESIRLDEIYDNHVRYLAIPDYDGSHTPTRDPIPCDTSPTCPAYVHQPGCPGA